MRCTGTSKAILNSGARVFETRHDAGGAGGRARKVLCKTALVVGSERLGLTVQALAWRDHVVEISVYGLPVSHNAAMAMALDENCRVCATLQSRTLAVRFRNPTLIVNHSGMLRKLANE